MADYISQAKLNPEYEKLKKQGLSDYKISTMGQPSVAAPVSAPKTVKDDLTPKAYQQYQDRLAGKGVSDTQQRIIDEQKRQAAEMAAAKTPEAQQQVYESNLQKRKETTLSHLQQNPNVSKEYLDLYQQKWNPMTGKMEGVTQEEWDMVNQAEWAKLPEDKKRNFESEQSAIEKFGPPSGPEEEAEYLQATYSNQQLAGLIETGQVDPNLFTAQKLSELGLTAERLQKLISMGVLRPELLQGLQAAGTETSITEQNLGATPKPTNEMMDIFRETINAKSEFKQQTLGLSDLFTQAGVSGYSVLAQSLRQRANEMETKSRSAANLVSSVGGSMASTYEGLLNQYNASRENFNKQMERLIKIDEDVVKHERLLELEGIKFENDKEMAEFKEELKRGTMEMENKINPATGGVDIYSTSGQFGVVGSDGQIRPLSSGETKVGGKVYQKSLVEKIFNVGGIGDWCGVFASTISTASKVGDTWAEKRQRITHQNNPTAGDKLLVPISVKSDKSDYGHVATVLDYNPENGNVWVVESNRDGRQNRGAGKGKVTFGVYNLNEMQRAYGDDWGFAKGDLKGDIKSALNKAGSLDVSPMVGAAAKLVTGNPAGAMLDLLGGMPEAIGKGALEIGQAKVAEENAMKTYAQRYADITGDEGVLLRSKDGSPTYKAGKELKARIAGMSSPEEVEDYFKKLEKEYGDKELKNLDKGVLDEVVNLGQTLIKEGESKADIYLELKKEYGKEYADAAIKKFKMGEKSRAKAITFDEQAIIDFARPFIEKGMAVNKVKEEIAKKFGQEAADTAISY